MSLGFPPELTDTERGLMTVGGVRTSDINPSSRRSQTAEETKSPSPSPSPSIPGSHVT